MNELKDTLDYVREYQKASGERGNKLRAAMAEISITTGLPYQGVKHIGKLYDCFSPAEINYIIEELS